MHGLEDEEDQNNFSDDDFDALPDSTLFELERYAIRSTQRPPAVQPSQHNARDEDVATRIQPESGPGKLQAAVAAQPVGWELPPRPQHVPGRFYSDAYENPSFEEEGIATPVEEKESFIRTRYPDEKTLREQWRQDRFARPNVLTKPNYPPVSRQRLNENLLQPFQLQKSPVPAGQDAEMQDSMLLDDEHAGSISGTRSFEEDALRAEIGQLMKERDKLAKELESTKSDVWKQSGEIAIIRANQIKESKVLDRQISALQRSLQDEATKHRSKVQDMLKEAQKIATENKFLKQDLAEETQKNRELQKSLKGKATANRAEQHSTTPEKAPAHSLRDGFDDGELVTISPSKSGRISKSNTPTTRGNRKRKVDMQSPVPSLVLRPSGAATAAASSSIPPIQPKEPDPVPKPEQVPILVRKDATAEKNLRFVQRILNYKAEGESESIIEAFMKYRFPSDPSKTFTSIVLESTARLAGKRLPADLLQIFVELWGRSLREKYYKPIMSLYDVVYFIMASNSSVLDAGTIKILLPVLHSSGEINGIPRFEYSPVAHQIFVQSRQIPQCALNKDVNGTACLEMLLNIACSCAKNPDKIELFWRSMSTDFVLMMLNSSQPISDISLMLQILSTSILPATFGNICGTDKEQQDMESYIIDRVCWLLWETPRVDESVPPPTRSEICTLRLEAIGLLNSLALSSSAHPHLDSSHHGATLLANHSGALARIVRCLYDEVDAMYMHTPTHAQHATIVNQGVRLLFWILKLNGENIDLQRKLSAINGGVHKHRVVLTRLAFGDRFFLDADIREETVDMALKMLEEVVTPEEADALVEAFPAFWKRREMEMEMEE